MQAIGVSTIVLTQLEFLQYPDSTEQIPEGFLPLESYHNQYIIQLDGEIKHRTRLQGNRWVTRTAKCLPKEAVATDVVPIKSCKEREKMLENNISILPEGKKIPLSVFYEVIAFFKGVMVNKMKDVLGDATPNPHTAYRHEYEAMAHIVWNSNTKEYRVTIPTQTVSKASVTYDKNYIDRATGDIMIVDIHSHNTMGAFFSGTDDTDDKGSMCYSGVVGKLDCATPSTVWRLNLGAEKVQIKFGDIFEEMVSLPSIPSEWLDKVTIQTYAVTYPYGNYGGYYGGRSGWGDDLDDFGFGGGGKKQNHAQGKGANVAIQADGKVWVPVATALSPESISSLRAALSPEIAGKVASLFPTEPQQLLELNDDLLDAWQEMGPDFDLALSLCLGMIVRSNDYPALRTLSVYDYLINEETGLVGYLDEAKKPCLQNTTKSGISEIDVGDFINSSIFLRSYLAKATPHGVTLDALKEDVANLIVDVTAGIVN